MLRAAVDVSKLERSRQIFTQLQGRGCNSEMVKATKVFSDFFFPFFVEKLYV